MRFESLAQLGEGKRVGVLVKFWVGMKPSGEMRWGKKRSGPEKGGGIREPSGPADP